jgi:hypothetical protein
MRMPSLAVMTLAATALLGTTAAFAGPFGSGGIIKTTENSVENLVVNHGDVLSGIFNVSQINGVSGSTYTYGAGGYYLVGVFTGFALDTATPFSVGPLNGFNLTFTGGSLKYYSFASDPFAGGALLNCASCVTPADFAAFQTASIATISTGTLELDLLPQVIDATHTLDILVAGGLSNFAAASTSTVYLDIIGGASQNVFVKDSLVNSFTAVLADANYQGSANTTDCATATGWQVCGTNHATLNVIPEPITLSLFGAGLAGAAAIRRRKVKKA